MKTLTIGRKISLACTALVGFTVLMGSVGTLSIGRTNSEIRALASGPLPGIYSLGLIAGYGKDQETAMLEHILADSPEQKAQLEATITDLENKFQAEMKEYEKTIETEKGRQQFAQLGPAQANAMRVWAEILPLSRAQKFSKAMALWNGEAAVAWRQRAGLFNDMLEFRRNKAGDEAKAAMARGDSAILWGMVVLGLAVIAGGGLGWFAVRGVKRVLTRAVTELSEGAEQVASASGQVSGCSQSLAQGASEQAASLQQTSASSEQLASMTRRNSENARQAAVVMNTVSERVAAANRTLLDMARSMAEIGESSNRISRIIRVIDEIAFQTNILALNAAVEAARAGEAGMGFAVVAEEVRNLAQRSAQAAKDTASLIEESIAKSGDGSRKLSEVASSIEAITEAAGQVKTLVDEVDASSKEQAKGIEQIAKAISQMDTVTQQTAANAEESASASEELNAQSQALMTVVEQLQTLVGSSSAGALQFSRPAAITRSPAAKPAPRHAATGVSAAKNAAGFPLDESEFKEF